MEHLGGQRRARGEELPGHHFTDLYGEKGDKAGQLIDERTGLPIDNSVVPESMNGMLPVVEGNDESLTIKKRTRGKNSEDALGALPEDDDAAAKWLRDMEAKGNA